MTKTITLEPGDFWYLQYVAAEETAAAMAVEAAALKAKIASIETGAAFRQAARRKNALVDKLAAQHGFDPSAPLRFDDATLTMTVDIATEGEQE